MGIKVSIDLEICNILVSPHKLVNFKHFETEIFNTCAKLS